MTEHEKLREICDKIGYDGGYVQYYGGFVFIGERGIQNGIKKDVREIIFTQEFMDKLGTFYLNKRGFYADSPKHHQDVADVIYYLDNPVEYIYNLIKD